MLNQWLVNINNIFWFKIAFFHKSAFFKDAAKVFSANVLVFVFSFFSSIITARYLGVEGKGLITTMLVYPNLAISLCNMGIRQVTVLEIGRKVFSYEKIVANVITIFLFMSIISVTICFFLLKINPSKFSPLLIIIAVSIIPLTLIKSYAGGIFLGKEKIGLSAVIAWLPQFLRLGCLIVFLVVFSTGLFGALISTIIAGLPVAFFALYKVFKNIKINPSWDIAIQKRMLGLGSVYALGLFVNSLNYRIDIIFLERITSASEVGLYSVGVHMAELILQVSSAVGLVIFSRSSNAKNPLFFSRKTIKVLKIGLLVAIAFGAIIYYIAPFAIPILYKNDFTHSVTMVQLLIPGMIALVGYKLIGFDMAGKGKPWFSINASLPGLFINIIFNLLLIPKYGGNGAAIASSISYSVMFVTHFIMFKRYLKRISCG